MPYLFCILTNLGGYAVLAWLGWCFVQTRSNYIILAIIIGFVFISHMVPGSEFFECPKCGHRDKVKVFNLRAMGVKHTAVRIDNSTPNDGD